MNKAKKNKAKNTFFIILDIIIVIIVIYFIIGYLNFFKITKNQEPLIKGTVNSYTKNGGEVVVNNYKLYKIVKYTIPNKNISYSMKLWFMDDVK